MLDGLDFGRPFAFVGSNPKARIFLRIFCVQVFFFQIEWLLIHYTSSDLSYNIPSLTVPVRSHLGKVSLSGTKKDIFNLADWELNISVDIRDLLCQEPLGIQSSRRVQICLKDETTAGDGSLKLGTSDLRISIAISIAYLLIY